MNAEQFICHFSVSPKVSRVLAVDCWRGPASGSAIAVPVLFLSDFRAFLPWGPVGGRQEIAAHRQDFAGFGWLAQFVLNHRHTMLGVHEDDEFPTPDDYGGRLSRDGQRAAFPEP
jgi:hypothetical protein